MGMSEFVLSVSGCLMLGIMTTLHPCPMAANIAAISFLSGTTRYKSKKISVLISFGFGYAIALLGLALLISFSLVSIPRLSIILQGVYSLFLGPMLIFIGMVLSEMIHVGHWFKGWMPRRELLQDKTAIYTFFVGTLLALTFCPATAFIFFGILIPLSVNNNQIFLFPVWFALGALIPIASISLLINYGADTVLNTKWVKKIPIVAGWMLIISGIYITLDQLYL